MTVTYPLVLLLLPLTLIPLWLQRQDGYYYSSILMIPEDTISDIASLALRYIVVILLACMLLSLVGIHGPTGEIERTGKGAQTVFVIDRSASMDDPFAGSGANGNVGETKSAAAKRLITQFVNKRKDDMVGITTFSNAAMHAIPLTQSREAIYAAIGAASGAGLLQTNIGAGLTVGISMFEKLANSGSRAIVLLSDGAGRLTPKTKQKIKDWIVREHINLYWIVLRQPHGISIFNPKYADSDMTELPAEIELHRFFQTLDTKYKAYEADDPKTLQSAIDDINLQELQPITYIEKTPGYNYSPIFIGIAILLLSILILIRHLSYQSWQ